MVITDDEIAFLRAYLNGDEDTTTQLWGQLTNATGLAAMTDTAFAIVARRKFVPAWSTQQVVRYVSKLRAALSDRPDVIDPRAAENAIKRALSDQAPLTVPDASIVKAQLILLAALVADLDLDPAGVDRLLEQAREGAHRAPQSTGDLDDRHDHGRASGGTARSATGKRR